MEDFLECNLYLYYFPRYKLFSSESCLCQNCTSAQKLVQYGPRGMPIAGFSINCDIHAAGVNKLPDSPPAPQL